MNKSIADIRKDYQLQTLLETDISADPFTQFNQWWDDAVKSELDEVNAMTLATASLTGMPAARIVLLKSFSDTGFVFFTNYNSHKGKELEENPQACLIFFWKELERQIRITGIVEKVTDLESDEYFNSRPAGSRIGAWASPQSSVIENRAILESRASEIEQRFKDLTFLPKPKQWGGFKVTPHWIEFWQGRESRLHDRILYTHEKDGWKIVRLAP